MRGEESSPRRRADGTEIPPNCRNAGKVVWSQASFPFTAAPIFVSKGRKAARICNMGDNLTAHPSAARWSVSPADAGALTEAFHLNHGAAHHPTALERASWSTPLEIMPYPNPPSAEKTGRMGSEPRLRRACSNAHRFRRISRQMNFFQETSDRASTAMTFMSAGRKGLWRLWAVENHQHTA